MFEQFEFGYINSLFSGKPQKRKHVLNECCITGAAVRALLRVYGSSELPVLWAVDPCTVAASIACRDESLLRGGRNRHARAAWLAMGDQKGPKEPIGIANFRSLSTLPELTDPKRWGGLRDALQRWNLGIAEAFLKPPADWSEDVPLADDRYLRALTTALTPRVEMGFGENPGIRPRIATVPFASQWALSGVCAQTSMYMVALQLCLPDRGHVRVDGPFSISCFAEDVRRCLEREAERQGQNPPRVLETIDLQEAKDNDLRAHETDCGLNGWREDVPDQKFKIAGATSKTVAETLRLFLSDPGARGPAGRPKMEPVHIVSTDLKIDDFRRIVESVVSSRLPLLVQIDMEIGRAAATSVFVERTKEGIELTDKERETYERSQRFLECARGVLEGKDPESLPKKLPSEPYDDDDYHPVKQIHSVVVIGAKGLLGEDDDPRILFHDPWYGPYQEAKLGDFLVASKLPFMKYVKEAGGDNAYKANADGCPVTEMIIPVPHNIRFAPHEVGKWDILGNSLSDPSLKPYITVIRDHVLPPSDAVEWRMRLLNRSAIWESYFAGTDIEKNGPLEMSSLLPSNRQSEHVLCLETFESLEDAGQRRPKTVFFGYIGPNGEHEDAYLTPFTGAFGVMRDTHSSLVTFYRITPGAGIVYLGRRECTGVRARPISTGVGG